MLCNGKFSSLSDKGPFEPSGNLNCPFRENCLVP